MPHLVAHHGLDLRQRRAVQEIVVERDPLGPEEPGDVRAHALRLFGGVDLPDLAGLDPVGPRQREDGRDHARVLELLRVVEQRHDQHRRDEGAEGHEPDAHHGAPDPPGPRKAPDQRVQHHRRETAEHDVDGQPLQLLADESRERQVG